MRQNAVVFLVRILSDSILYVNLPIVPFLDTLLDYSRLGAQEAGSCYMC
jgi:hypothetical protein